jgi:DNA-directed RNA polymerase specialized sigma24 family protein
VSRRILRDIDLAEDATQHALVAIWRDLPQLRDPERFDAWSYRLLVRACYAEGRRSRAWSPNLRILPNRSAYEFCFLCLMRLLVGVSELG